MTIRRSGAAGLALAAAVGLSACGSDGPSTASGAPAGPSAAGVSCASGSATGAGSSAQKNAVDEWIKAYQQSCSGATVNYQPSGSGAGIEAFVSGTVDFAGSDSALKDDEVDAAQKRCGSGKALNLPMVIGPIAVAYKLGGVSDLVLDAPTIAKMFSGKITMWNDPAIAALNQGKQLPATRIQAFHRSDESGTTDNFQKYLDAAAEQDWTYGTGKKFAAPGGQSAAKSDGVTQAVTSTDGAITYVEQSFAENAGLGVAQIATGAGTPVKLTGESAAKAVEAAEVTGKGNDLQLELDYATKAEGAYPIVLVTYEIVCEKGTPADKLPLVKSFLSYTSSEQGQSGLQRLGYAPLPSSIRIKVATAVGALA
ncbi:MAG: phosphate ABC transporter substrate-binding protein PstS [Actinomycetota bacterium]|nr:phosphate ABC transporter substrate-binding protein PstS [Actinomycetota bacterium]